MARNGHKCANAFYGAGARGGCLFEIQDTNLEGTANLLVGHSCVYTHQGEIPITWLSELVTIANDHEGGIAGFLRDHETKTGEPSYALQCDPAPFCRYCRNHGTELAAPCASRTASLNCPGKIKHNAAINI